MSVLKVILFLILTNIIILEARPSIKVKIDGKFYQYNKKITKFDTLYWECGKELKEEVVHKVTTPPKIVHNLGAFPTREMLIKKITGEVITKALIGSDGKVKKIIVHYQLGHGAEKSSIDAVKRMKFKSAKVGNKKVSCWIRIIVPFKTQVSL